MKTVEFLHVKSHLVHSLKKPILCYELYSVLEIQTCKTRPCHWLVFCTRFPIHLTFPIALLPSDNIHSSFMSQHKGHL